MPFTRDDVEQFAEAIGVVHGHPDAKGYALAVGATWAELRPAKGAAKAPAQAPAPAPGADPVIPPADA